ncbi:hypothetical protein [Kitasatospora cineracea]|uniref:hypothetical protein n=1 Tax=Kitasatospora cineracea TaxID=88074 RepID=UPI0033D63661
MSDSMNSGDSGFEELLSGLSERFEAALFEQRIASLALAARGAGLVYVEAITSGVPHDLAQAMAAEVWTAETGPLAAVEGEEEEA